MVDAYSEFLVSVVLPHNLAQALGPVASRTKMIEDQVLLHRLGTNMYSKDRCNLTITQTQDIVISLFLFPHCSSL